MEFSPLLGDRLHAILNELVLGPTGAHPVELGADICLLASRDRDAAILLVRGPIDEAGKKICRHAMREICREMPVEVLLVGETDVERRRLLRARPMLTDRGIRVLHLMEDGQLWVERRRIGQPEGPLAKYLEAGGRGAASPDWDAFSARLRTVEDEARCAQENLQALQASNRPIATWALAALVLAFFGLQFAFGAVQSGRVLQMGALDKHDVVDGQIWRLISCTFLHGGIVHLLFNLAALVMFGVQLERMLGTARYLLIYTAAALGGSLVSVTANGNVSVGASGALWGLMTAQLIFVWRSAGILPSDMRKRALSGAGQNLALNLMNSFRPGVDWAAHLGGGLAGVLVMLLLLAGVRRDVQTRKEGKSPAGARGLATAAGVCAAVLLVGAVLGPIAGRPWRTLLAPEFARIELPGVGHNAEVPTGLKPRREANEIVLGDLYADPLLLSVRITPVADDQQRASGLDSLQASLTSMPAPDRMNSDGPAARRTVEGATILERTFSMTDGMRYRRLVRLIEGEVVWLDVIESAGLPDSWRAAGEHTLLSIQRTASR